MSAEKNTPQVPENSEPFSNEELETEMRRQKLAAVAATLLSENLEGRDAQKRAKATEMFIGMEATSEARIKERMAQQERQQQIEEAEPWGIEQLIDARRSSEEIRAKVSSERQDVAKQKEIRAEQTRKIPLALAETRQLTLAEARHIAQELKESGVQPDTNILFGEYPPQDKKDHEPKTARPTEKPIFINKQWQEEQKKPEHERDKRVRKDSPDARGWLIPISGRSDNACIAVLTEDGRILTTYSNIEKGKENKDGSMTPNMLFVQPDWYGQVESRKETPEEAKKNGHVDSKGKPKPRTIPVKTSPDHIYSRFMNEAFNSDIGMGTIPVSKIKGAGGEHLPTTTFGANAILERETSMQESLHHLFLAKTQEAIPIISTPRPKVERKPNNDPSILDRVRHSFRVSTKALGEELADQTRESTQVLAEDMARLRNRAMWTATGVELAVRGAVARFMENRRQEEIRKNQSEDAEDNQT